MAKSVKKNYIFNLAYQLLLIIVPLVVTPYVSRVLQPEGVGQFSFSFSIITYFTLFAALGFSFYGQREIARKSGDDKAQSIIFWEIILARSGAVVVALATNIALALTKVYGDYSTLMLVMSGYIVGIFFDVAFYFQGREEFGKIVLSNSIVRILSVVAIFLLVKGPNDVWTYCLINAASSLVGFLALWPLLIQSLKKVSPKELKPFRHLKGTLILFLPTIAVSIYTVLDKTLIGVLVEGTFETVDETGAVVIKKYADVENGYYEQSEKIVKMLMTVITCLGTVMIPRNTKEFAEGNVEQVKTNIYTSSKLVWMLGVPMALGLALAAPFFVPLFFGEGYDKCVTLMSVLGSLVVIIGFSNVFGLQYLVPSKQDKKYTISLILGAVVNLCLNLVLIRFWWSLGAAIATVVAEIIVTVTMAIFIRKQIDLKVIIASSWRYLLAGAVMFVPLYFVRRFFPQNWVGLIIVVGCGIVIYFAILFITRDPLLKKAVHAGINKIKRKPKENNDAEV